MTIDPNDLGATAHQTFADDFNSLNLWNGQAGTWATTFLFADPHGNGSSLPSNGEQEWYVNSLYAPTTGVQPWAAANGVLTITAQPTDSSISGLLGYANGEGPGLGSYGYTSGLLTSAHSFSQTYGYFEMSAKLPSGDGLWPAFWLLPSSGAWPPELDAMEVLGKDPATLYTSIHTAQNGSHASDGVATVVGDTSGGFHTYGIDWEADKVTWYFDGRPVFQADTPADMHSPMYMLANLAVGGGWPGPADGSTPFPAQMQIDYIRAYAAGAGPATGDTGPAQPTSPSPAPVSQQQQGLVGNDTPGQWLVGGSEDQTLTAGHNSVFEVGGQGADRFVFDALPWNGGHITDFTPGADKIDLSHLISDSQYWGSDPVADGYLHVQDDGAGGAQVLYDPDGWSGGNTIQFLVTTTDHLSPQQLSTSDFIFR